MYIRIYLNFQILRDLFLKIFNFKYKLKKEFIDQILLLELEIYFDQ
jgi:hypothetical protein